jgi:hypothetical protein
MIRSCCPAKPKVYLLGFPGTLHNIHHEHHFPENREGCCKKNIGVIWIQAITIFWEKHHYDSDIGKLVIAIFDFPQKIS